MNPSDNGSTTHHDKLCYLKFASCQSSIVITRPIVDVCYLQEVTSHVVAVCVCFLFTLKSFVKKDCSRLHMLLYTAMIANDCEV